MSSPLLFLSHAGCDSDAALTLASEIEATPEAIRANLKVWIDKRSLRPGTPWQQQIEDAIEHKSTAFAIFLTEAGAEHWVRTEIRAALDRVISDGQRGKAYAFIPIVAHSTRDISRLPLFARQYQGVHLSSRSALVDLVAAATAASGRHSLPLVAEPFVGLESFGDADTHLFFGRRRETQEVLERLKTTPLLVVVGDSGSGKSSLVKAGVVPAFREGMLSDPMAPRPGLGAWHVVQMRPGRDPIQSLIDAVANAARDVSGLNTQLLDAAFVRLRGLGSASGDPAAAIDMLREGAQVGASCLLVVDQFEELWSQALDERPRSLFIEALLKLVRSGGEKYRVIGTMRRDYVFQLASNVLLRAQLEDSPQGGRYNLRRMGEAQLRECVENPLALAGVAPDESKLLADEVLRDAGDEPGQLAMLEMALYKTWEERSAHATLLDAYKAIGRIEGALSRAADQALGRLAATFPHGREAAETIFVRLVTQSADGAVARRTASREEFEPSVWQLAQALGTREFNRLLVLGLRDEGAVKRSPLASTVKPDTAPFSPELVLTVELAHEQIATQWDQYRLWLKRNDSAEQDKRALDRLMFRSGEWTQQGRRFREATTSRLERLVFERLSKRRPQWLSQSEARFIRTARMRARAPIAGLIVATLLSGSGFWVMQERQRVNEQAVLLWNGLDLKGQISKRDSDTVFQLAAADADVKLLFAEKLMLDPGLAERFLRNPRSITVALAGPTPQLRAVLIRKIVTRSTSSLGPEQLLAVAHLGIELQTSAAVEPLLQAMKSTSDPIAISSLAVGLPLVSGGLDKSQAERAIDPLLRALKAARDPFAMRALALGLQAVPAKLDSAQAESAVVSLLNALDTNLSDTLMWAGFGLRAVVAKLEAEQTERVVVQLLQAINTSDPAAHGPLTDILQAVVAKLEPSQAERSVEQLLRAMNADSNTLILRELAQVLLAMPVRLEAAQAHRAVERLLQAIKATNNPNALEALGEGLKAVVAKLDASQAQRAVEHLLQAIKKTSNPHALRALALGLGAIPSNVDAPQGPSAVEPLLRAIMDTSDPQALMPLAEALKALATKLDTARAKRAFEPLLRAMKATSDPDALIELAEALAGLPAKLDAAQSQRAVDPLLQAITIKTDQEDLKAIANVLKTVAVKLDAAQAERVIESLLQGIRTTRNAHARLALAEVLRAVPTKLDVTQGQRAVEPFLEAIEALRDPDALYMPAVPLVTANTGLAQAVPTVDRLQPAIKTSQPGYLRAMVEGLQAVSVNLDTAQAHRARESVLKAIYATSDAVDLSTMAGVLQTMSPKLNAAQAQGAVNRLLEVIKTKSDRYDLHLLGSGLESVAATLDTAQAARAINPLLQAISATENQDALEVLGDGLQAVVGKLDAAHAERAINPLLQTIKATRVPGAIRVNRPAF